MRAAGEIGLLVAFVSTGYATFACFGAWRWRDGRLRTHAAWALLASLACVCLTTCILAIALLAKDYRFAYVAQYTSRMLPWHYSLSALWVGQAGSLLLWTCYSVLLSNVYWFWPRRVPSPLREPAGGFLALFCFFLVSVMVFGADPMAASNVAPREGAGLSPLLQHPAMLLHPPVVFLGYALWSLPCALAAAALLSRPTDRRWIREARSWALVAWTVLGSAILLGAEWAYEELGWGGYWGWDPVENASLIPWLTGTAFIHAAMAWHHLGVLKKTAVALALATFGMCHFATFLTRSGLLSSVHAFSQSPIGWYFLFLLIVLIIGGAYLIVRERFELAPERRLSGPWSRESIAAVSMVALTILALGTTGGTLAPALSELVVGRRVVVGTEYYNGLLAPLGLILLTGTAMAPLLRWGSPPGRAQKHVLTGLIPIAIAAGVIALLCGIRHPIALAVACVTSAALVAVAGSLYLDATRLSNSRGFARNALWVLSERRSQYSGFLIHIGLFVLAVGVTASSLGTRQIGAVLGERESVVFGRHTVRLVGYEQFECPDRLVAEVQLEVFEDGGKTCCLKPSRQLHLLQNEWTTEVAIHSSWSGDLYAVLQSGEGDRGVRLTLTENPLMRFIWMGGGIMGTGVLVRLWPARRGAGRTDRLLFRPRRTRSPLRSAVAFNAREECPTAT
jgi:cytochrome c-type biogenesis protein CcmF